MQAAASFALTKIQPPRSRGGLIARPALEQRLADATARSRLVLLSAAAGFGKTTALSQQFGKLPAGTAVAWISADADDDLARLLACLFAALEPLALPWAGEPDTLLAARDRQPAHRPALAWALQNALAGARVPHGVIVIDDAHRITDPAAFAFLDALLEHLPAHWTLLLASRDDPPLALPRLRARGELAEFRAEDLALGADEAEALAGARGSSLPAAAVQRLHERSGGWPAGFCLGLAAEAGGAAARWQRDRAVFDYLGSEVLAGLPAELGGFLLRCAALQTLSPSDCAAVSGHADAATLLDEVERRGLFVSAAHGAGSGKTPLLRLHPVWRDCLRAAAQRELPEEWPGLLQRAEACERARELPPSLDGKSTEVHPSAPACPTAGRDGAVPAALAMPASLLPSDAHAAPATPAAPAWPLSTREREVLARIASGDSNKLIARAFDLSPHTVKRHVANILDKLVVCSRVQAAAWHQAHQASQREMA